MRKYIGMAVVTLIVVAGVVLGIVLGGFHLDELQREILLINGIICACSALYCFVVGEITRNNSQMDKLWSILPIAYAWVVAIKAGMQPRLLVYAIIVTLWGIRLTYNFAKKGAYRLKFWEGEEDYRWQVLRQKPILEKRIVWALFDLFFISIYQNALVLAITFPALASASSTVAIGVFDIIAFVLATGFLALETIADIQQMRFHTRKKEYLKDGTPLSDIPAPYNKGFNTTGIWKRARHPNYLGEQGIWISLYLICIGAGVTNYGIFSWCLGGPLLLIFLFMGSSEFGEGVSNSKYPEYKYYLGYVSKYFPLWPYNEEKAKAKYEKRNGSISE